MNDIVASILVRAVPVIVFLVAMYLLLTHRILGGLNFVVIGMFALACLLTVISYYAVFWLINDFNKSKK